VDLASTEERENPSPGKIFTSLLVHLRLHYQLLLAPIFLWGAFLSGPAPGLDFWLGFLAFHVFLYGGSTAFNSYYDRDRGPIGGLSKPPPVHEALLPFSLAVSILGIGLAALVNPQFLAIYTAMLLLGIAYSHPKIRLKKHPLVGLATVGLGQGVLAALGGWFSVRPDLAGFTLLDLAGILAVTLVTVGFYPVTQIYQIDEDRSRGDQTFAVWAGVARTFRFSIAVQMTAVILLALVIGPSMGWGEAALVSIFYVGLLAYIAYWGRNFHSEQVLSNFRRVMGSIP
jgi:4-hydroxybenzoate polyprenyltransferase